MTAILSRPQCVNNFFAGIEPRADEYGRRGFPITTRHQLMHGSSTFSISWWRHQMEKCSALLAICAGNSPVPGEFPAQRPVTRSFDVFFDLHLNKRLSKQWWGWWFETPSCPLWRHCNVSQRLVSYLYCSDNIFYFPGAPFANMVYVIRQYDSCNTGELDRHAQHQQPCLASRTPRVIVRQEQPVLSGTHWSSFAHRQMSVVLCLRRFPMKIENCHIRHQRPLKVHQRPPR